MYDSQYVTKQMLTTEILLRKCPITRLHKDTVIPLASLFLVGTL